MKNCCLSGLLITCFFFSHAQPKISYGVGAGINLSTASYSLPYNDYGEYGKNGFIGYGFADTRVYKQFSIQSEIGYYHFGTSSSYTSQILKTDYYNQTISLNYLTFSILPKFSMNHSGWSLFAGPSLGFTTGKKILVYTNMNFAAASRMAFPTYTSNCLFGVAGLGYAFPGGLGISARYMYGFSSILETTSFMVEPNSAHQQSFNFSLNYAFQ